MSPIVDERMNTEVPVIEVGMAEMKISSAPAVVVARGLGSCVGVALYDPLKKVGGIAHPMLPRMGEFKAKGNPGRYVDYMISLMIDEMQRKGCRLNMLTAKIFGGAHMFSSIPQDSAFNIGARNIKVAREKLESYAIRLASEEVGGNYGRTIFLDLDTGLVKVRTMFFGERNV